MKIERPSLITRRSAIMGAAVSLGIVSAPYIAKAQGSFRRGIAPTAGTTIYNSPFGAHAPAVGSWGVVLSGGSSRPDTNADGTVGWLAFGAAGIQSYIYFPYSGEYTFTIPAYYVTVAPSNSLLCYVDQIPLATVGALPGNDFCTFVTNTAPVQSYVFKGFVLAGVHSVMIGFCQAAFPGFGTPQFHVDRLMIATTGNPYPADPPGNRNPLLFPLASRNHWNLPITDAAVWSNAGDADTITITTSASFRVINSASFSTPIYFGQSTDPITSFSDSDVTQAPLGTGPSDIHMIHAPAGMTVAPGSDTTIAIYDRTNPRYSYVGFNGSISGSTVVVGRGKMIDHYNGGNQAMAQDETQFTGIMRTSELQAGVFNHQLCYGLANQFVLSPPTTRTGLAWPACETDFNGPFGQYTGNVRYGSLIGIPLGTSRPGGLSQQGIGFWNALVNFGAIQNITGGSPNPQITFFAEQSSATLAPTELNNLNVDLAAILPFCRIMRNSTAATPKGGGNPLVPLLPGLIKGLPSIFQ